MRVISLFLAASLLAACGDRLEQRAPADASAAELARREACVAFFATHWPRGEEVVYTDIERQPAGQTQVWINIDVTDDHSRLAQRVASGTLNAGSCHFQGNGEMVQAQWFKLRAPTAGASAIASGTASGVAPRTLAGASSAGSAVASPDGGPRTLTARAPGFEWH